jgi:hypothetical protein
MLTLTVIGIEVRIEKQMMNIGTHAAEAEMHEKISESATLSNVVLVGAGNWAKLCMLARTSSTLNYATAN